MAKMGRPKAEEPKNNRITIRFTDNEIDLLKNRAESHGLTMAQYVRRLVEKDEREK